MQPHSGGKATETPRDLEVWRTQLLDAAAWLDSAVGSGVCEGSGEGSGVCKGSGEGSIVGVADGAVVAVGRVVLVGGATVAVGDGVAVADGPGVAVAGSVITPVGDAAGVAWHPARVKTSAANSKTQVRAVAIINLPGIAFREC